VELAETHADFWPGLAGYLAALFHDLDANILRRAGDAFGASTPRTIQELVVRPHRCRAGLPATVPTDNLRPSEWLRPCEGCH